MLCVADSSCIVLFHGAVLLQTVMLCYAVAESDVV